MSVQNKKKDNVISGVINRHVEVGLRWIGAYPGSNSSIGYYIILSWMLFNIPFEIWHAASIYHNVEALMANLGVLMAVSAAIIKLVTFRVQRKNISVVVNEVLNDWIAENEISDSEIISKNLARGSYFTKWLIGAYNGLLLTYVYGCVTNYRMGIVERRGYVLPARFPEPWKQSPTYEIVCGAQFIATFCNTSSNAMIEGLLAILVLHTGTKAYIIKRELERFAEIAQFGKNKKEVRKAMKSLIQKHWDFIDFVERIEYIYTFVSFIHVMIYTLLHVIVAYMLLEVLEKGERGMKVFLYTLFTTRALLSTMIYCVAGEHLMNQSEQVFKDLYDCSWYDFNLEDKKAIGMILMRARQPMCLTPAKFGQLSHAYLSSIIRMSYSILSLTRATR